jgi:class 3 adenylate cyclase/tetratricopeptide (TPR) repeat protein
MQRVSEWLEKLGLVQYAQRFAENDITFAILPDLTDQDLKELGVASLGHRRQLLRAIVELGNAPTTPAPTAPRSSSPTPIASPTETAGERRYLTVMFCDLVGSTSISAGLDAEEWRDLVSSYLDTASAAVTAVGGHVAKKLGDGILALFGYPLAHENDAERAAHAALAIQRALADWNVKNAGSGKPELKARIGLETGPAVVDASGEIYGDVANVAARVQAQADPGAVLITARVLRQIGGLFVAEDRGMHALKGVPEPTALFKLVRASGGDRHTGQRQLTPLVGRDDEMTMLTRRWQRAQQGDGQLVMIVGEPGLGKSRLIEEFHTRLRDIPHTWIEWSCSQLLQNTPLHPIAEWGRQRFGGNEVPEERRLAALESSLTQAKVDPAEFTSLIAPLLDMPLPKEHLPALAPEELRRRQLAALTNWVMAGAKQQPVVLAFEDLQWADPTTLDVLHGIAEQGALAPLFVVATARPEFRSPWSMRSHHGTISLAPLDRAQVRDMVAELSARYALPQNVVEDVVARTTGVPLFVEEVTRLLLERGEQGGVQAIPPTLQQLLMARLDRLGSAREVAHVGSVIGRRFSYGLLRQAAGMEDMHLQAALAKLADADIVLVQGLAPDSAYHFKHALIQEAAYENLLKSRRQILHRRVAEVLRDQSVDTGAAEPEVLAHHLTQAGMTATAIEWWGKAGDRAVTRSALAEAIAHFTTGLKLAEGLPTSEDRLPRQLEFLLKLGPMLMVTKGMQSPEVEDTYRRAAEIGAATGDGASTFKAKWGLWLNANIRRKTSLARERASELVELAQQSNDDDLLLEAYHCRWSTAFFRGEVPATLADSRLGVNAYDMARHRHLTHIYAGHDPGVCAHAVAGVSLVLADELDEGSNSVASAVALAEALEHPNSLAHAFWELALFNQLIKNRERVAAASRRVAALAEKYGLAPYRTTGLLLLTWAEAVSEASLANAAQTFDTEIDNAIARATVPQYFLGLGGEVALNAGRPADGLAYADRALAAIDEPGVGFYLPEIYRLRGECLLAVDRNNKGEARHAFETAQAIARQQGATLFERAALASRSKVPG